jgi:tetratricopeptide (TPR) repeat protein
MFSNRTSKFLYLPAILVLMAVPGVNQTLNVILRGTVTMEDGSAPGKSVGTEKVCSDRQGSGPGPLTKSSGEYIWRVDLDYMNSKVCYIQATLQGYDSTQVDISHLNPIGVNVDLPPIKLTPHGGDPYLIGEGEPKDIPDKSKSAWDSALKAVSANDIPGAAAKLEAAVEANPKFALGWHNLGILYNFLGDDKKSRAAFTRAIEVDPKLLPPHIVITRLLIKDGNWAEAAKMAATTVPLDKNRIYPELYLHQAVAEYHLKDLAMAETHAKQALDPKNKRSAPRAEYALGRILEAKGDTTGAKQHMSRYLELAPDAPDASIIKAHIENMGKADAPEPALENITR